MREMETTRACNPAPKCNPDPMPEAIRTAIDNQESNIYALIQLSEAIAGGPDILPPPPSREGGGLLAAVNYIEANAKWINNATRFLGEMIVGEGGIKDAP